MSIGVWVKQGIVLPTASDFPAQPNVLYEAGAIILTPNPDGKIFRMWFENDTGVAGNGICYAESADGITWTRYVSNPLFSSAGTTKTYSRMWKDPSTLIYWYFTGSLGGPIKVYNSTDGIAWTLRNATGLVEGTAGAWDDGFLNLMNIAGKIGSTYYAYYAGAHSSNGPIAFGQATSTDLITWTKTAGNPVITSFNPANFFWAQVSGRTYGWSIIQLPNLGGHINNVLPSDFMRFVGSSPAGPFTQLGTTTYYRTVSAEGVGQNNTGQVADPCLLEFNGQVYMWHTIGNATPGGISLSIYSGTLAQLVQTYEGVLNIPIPRSTLQLGPLNSGNFTGANANPIGGNFTAYSTIAGATSFAPAQLLSNQVLGTVAGKNSDSFWNANAFNNDQWAQVTVAQCLANSSVGVILRAGATGQYRLYWLGALGSNGGWTIQKYTVSGNSFVSLAARSSPTVTDVVVNAGDTITASAVGTTLSLYHNGDLIVAITDSTWTAGSIGLIATPITSTANAALSAWSGGNIQSAPPVPAPSGGGAGTTGDMLIDNRLCTRLWG